MPLDHSKGLSSEAEQLHRKFKGLQQALPAETDRGCALLAVAFLDQELSELLRSHICGSKAVKNKILDHSGPLGNLSAKIDMVYCMGLLGKNSREDLRNLARIRNKFAHLAEPISFKSESVKKDIANLYYVEFAGTDNPRGRFIEVVYTLAGRIHTTIMNTEPIKEAKSTTREEMAGLTTDALAAILEMKRRGQA